MESLSADAQWRMRSRDNVIDECIAGAKSGEVSAKGLLVSLTRITPSSGAEDLLLELPGLDKQSKVLGLNEEGWS